MWVSLLPYQAFRVGCNMSAFPSSVSLHTPTCSTSSPSLTAKHRNWSHRAVISVFIGGWCLEMKSCNVVAQQPCCCMFWAPGGCRLQSEWMDWKSTDTTLSHTVGMWWTCKVIICSIQTKGFTHGSKIPQTYFEILTTLSDRNTCVVTLNCFLWRSESKCVCGQNFEHML